MRPKILKGESNSDSRGTLFYNNDFDASEIKRVYVIENVNTDFNRAWQGHKIEKRWFSVVQGSFKIMLVLIDDWDNPSKDLSPIEYILECDKLDVLYVPMGYANSIQSLAVGSKLLVMSNYFFGEIDDEYRYALDHFNKKQE